MNSLEAMRTKRLHVLRRKNHIAEQQERLEEEFKIMLKVEEQFFSKQVGKYFLSKNKKRFWKILDYCSYTPYADCGTFEVECFDLFYRLPSITTTTCYNIFGHDFTVEEISKEGYEKAKANTKGTKR